jgi:hypothetical protein
VTPQRSSKACPTSMRPVPPNPHNEEQPQEANPAAVR